MHLSLHRSTRHAAVLLALLGTAWTGAHAQATNHDAHHTPAPASAPAAAAAVDNAQALSDGEVTRRDARTGKLTIRHGEIANLGMPPMTMVFALQDPAQGSTLKPGDKVRFRAQEVNGALLITHIEAAH